MKTALEFSRLRTATGLPVAQLISDYRTKMDGYDLSKPPRHHADSRTLLLISQEYANTLAALELAEKLMAHDWDGKKKFVVEPVRILSREFVVVMASRPEPGAPPAAIMLSEIQGAGDWAPNRFFTPAERFEPKNLDDLGANYYAVGPVYVGAGRKPRQVALGYTTHAHVVEGLELSDVWPIVLPDRAD
jgi:hypothetical protein